MPTLDLDMYDFLIKPIRDQDVQKGNEFVRRLLQGGQAVWQTIIDKIESIKNLWSVTDCPDDYLKYLKLIVGWTPDLDGITAEMDAETLRRLIAASIPIWKARSTEDSIIRVVSLLVPGRSRIWNWFDFRWVTNETILSEEHQGRDPWMVYFPGPTEGREYWSNVRIVDTGTADRTMVKDILNLMRPCGERYRIVYLALLDLFNILGDWSQWDSVVGDSPIVADGALKLQNATQEQYLAANVAGSADWDSYVAFTRTRCIGTAGDFGLLFYLDATLKDGYYAALNVAQNRLRLYKLTGGTPATLVTYDFSGMPYALQENVWYGLRIQISPEGSPGGATNRIVVYWNGMELINTTDATWTKGSVGPYGGTVKAEFDEIEVLGLPVETETVEINY